MLPECKPHPAVHRMCYRPQSTGRQGSSRGRLGDAQPPTEAAGPEAREKSRGPQAPYQAPPKAGRLPAPSRTVPACAWTPPGHDPMTAFVPNLGAEQKTSVVRGCLF